MIAKGRALRESLGLPDDLHDEWAPGFSGLFDELVFGVIWSRPGLDLRSRMVATLAALAALYELAIRYGYGVLWTRPGLSRRERFITSVSVFTVLEQNVQLTKFAASALCQRLHDLSAPDIERLCGLPAAGTGFGARGKRRGDPY